MKYCLSATQLLLDKLKKLVDDGGTVLQFSDRLKEDGETNVDYGVPWYDGRVNTSFSTNDPLLAEHVQEWTDGEKHGPPICADGLKEGQFVEKCKY